MVGHDGRSFVRDRFVMLTPAVSKGQLFGPAQPNLSGGQTFETALVVGGTWSAHVTLFGGMPLLPTGSISGFDAVVNKVEPPH